ncbi:MAG TPA: TetR/AcrR family transcriptional regulator [Burkholderiaceae bacterium]
MNCPFSCKPRWERRKDARPQELLAAALDLFVERGFASTRLEDVAKRAGVSKGTLYLYFTNKEELFKAVVRENLVPELGVAEEAVANFTGDTRELFGLSVMLWWDRIGNSKLSGISKLIMAEAGNFPELAAFYHEEVITRVNQLIVDLLDRGIARGEFRQVDTQETARLVAAQLVMLMMWKHSFGACQNQSISSENYLKCMIDLCLNGLTKPISSL